MIAHKIRKRSLIGSRVAVPSETGFYIPATVQAVSCNEEGSECVTAVLDNNIKKECPIPDVIGNGNGFKSIAKAKLRKFQKVYFLTNGIENTGYVDYVEGETAWINYLDIKKGQIKIPLKDLHLVEARQITTEPIANPVYRKIASTNSSPKRRTVSNSIEVPKTRRTSEEPTMDELMAAMVLTNMSSSPVFHNPKSPLIKRDISPHSYGSSGVGSWNQETHMMSPTKQDDEEVEQKEDTEKEQNMETDTSGNNPASPEDPIEADSDEVAPQSYSEKEADHIMERNIPIHYTIKKEFTYATSPTRPTVLVSPRSQPYPTKNIKLSSVSEENHCNDMPQTFPIASVYYVPNIFQPSLANQHLHYGQVGNPPQLRAVSVDERPYRELSPLVAKRELGQDEQNIAYIGSAPPNRYFPLMQPNAQMPSSPISYSPSPHARHTSSPLTNVPSFKPSSSMPMTNMHQSAPIAIGGYSVLKDHCYQTGHAQPINIPSAKAFSWHSTHVPPSFSPKPSLVQQRQHMHQAASPKMSIPPTKQSLPPGRSKVRGDGKKCRKVYGMENRDMWCTACRWKKACQRFPD